MVGLVHILIIILCSDPGYKPFLVSVRSWPWTLEWHSQSVVIIWKVKVTSYPELASLFTLCDLVLLILLLDIFIKIKMLGWKNTTAGKAHALHACS